MLLKEPPFYGVPLIPPIPPNSAFEMLENQRQIGEIP